MTINIFREVYVAFQQRDFYASAAIKEASRNTVTQTLITLSIAIVSWMAKMYHLHTP